MQVQDEQTVRTQWQALDGGNRHCGGGGSGVTVHYKRALRTPRQAWDGHNTQGGGGTSSGVLMHYE